jgi:hypothetical protein
MNATAAEAFWSSGSTIVACSSRVILGSTPFCFFCGLAFLIAASVSKLFGDSGWTIDACSSRVIRGSSPFFFL